MLDKKKSLLYHLRVIQKSCVHHLVDPILDCRDFKLTLCHKQKTYILYPQFILFQKTGVAYTATFDEEVKVFAGWRPYHSMELPLFTDKWNLKKYLLRCNLLTPKYTRDPQSNLKNVIVKNCFGSFGKAIKGPFHSAQDYPQIVQDEHYEQLIEGEITKVWFWKETPVVMEVLEVPFVIGTGKDSIKMLIQRHLIHAKVQLDWNHIKQVLSYYGDNKLTTTLPAGKHQIVALTYRAARRLHSKKREYKCNALKEIALYHAITKVGKMLWSTIEDQTEALLFTVDAIISREGSFWILEANSNPVVHPDVYPSMLDTLF